MTAQEAVNAKQMPLFTTCKNGHVQNEKNTYTNPTNKKKACRLCKAASKRRGFQFRGFHL